MVEGAVNRKLSWADASQRAGYGFTSRSSGLGLPGLLFRAGEKTQMTGVVDALGAENPFVAGTLTGHYATDSVIPRVLTSSFVAIPLSRRVPNIVLLAKGLGMLTLAGIGLDGRQRLSLEGNFDRTFTLYCPEGYERDALEIFAPNLMSKLVETTGGCDVELVDDWMFVYSRPGRYRSGAALTAVEDATAMVQATVRRQTSRYTDQRAQAARTTTVSPQEHAARAGGIAPAGRRVTAGSTPVQQLAGTITGTLLVVAVVVYVVAILLPRL